MPRLTPVKWAGVAASFALLVTCSVGGIQGQEQPIQRTAETEVRQGGRFTAPLERLKARSPQQRWEQISRPEQDPTLQRPVEPVNQTSAPAENEIPIGVLQPVSRPNRRTEIGSDEFRPLDQISPAGSESEHYVPLPESQEVGQDTLQWRNAAPTPVDDLTIDSQPAQAGQIRVEKFTAEEAAALEMTPQFPDINPGQAANFGAYTTEQNTAPSNDPIYEEIEEEFPRIQLTVPPEAEFAQPLRQPQEQPLQQPVVPNPVMRTLTAQRQDYGTEDDWDQTKELITSPKDIKPLSDIQPFFDYEPDAELRGTDPYLNVFPRPDGVVETGDQKQFPEVIDLGEELYQQRNLAHVDYNWVATDNWHYPLYFEDAAFERYGHTYDWWFQPFASFGTFSLQFFGLPYQMSIHPMWEHQYTLGWYRPGEYVPYKWYQVPWNTDAAARTAAFYTGMIYAFP